MGDAIWLFIWLVHAQTRRNGLVYGGRPLTCAEIHDRTGYGERSIRRWLQTLRLAGYVEVKHSVFKKLVIRVLKQKKFSTKQSQLPLSDRPTMADQAPSLSANPGRSLRPNVADTVANSGRFNNDLKPMNSTETPERESSGADILEAFGLFGTPPFGSSRFVQAWTNQYKAHLANGATTWSQEMENTIQFCRRAKITVPGEFFAHKREIEKIEAINAHKRTPI